MGKAVVGGDVVVDPMGCVDDVGPWVELVVVEGVVVDVGASVVEVVVVVGAVVVVTGWVVVVGATVVVVAGRVVVVEQGGGGLHGGWWDCPAHAVPERASRAMRVRGRMARRFKVLSPIR